MDGGGDTKAPAVYVMISVLKTAEAALYAFTKGKTILQVGVQWKEVEYLILQVEEAATSLLQEDFEYIIGHGLDQRVWRCIVHQFVDSARNFIKQNPDKKEHVSKNILPKVLIRGMNYFQNLLGWIDKSHPIVWSNIHGAARFKKRNKIRNFSESALEMYTRILVNIGDAHRYNYADPGHLANSMRYYERAQKMNPGNARPFYQMGIVVREKGDVVGIAYNFTRALVAPEPIEEARENLLDFYDVAYKKYKIVEPTSWFAKTNKTEGQVDWRRFIRMQIWPNSLGPTWSIPRLPEDPHTKEVHFKTMTDREVYSRFSLSYVNYLGKLFTHIGLDTLDDVAQEALVYFERLFCNTSNGFPPLRLTQILTLNMIMIHRFAPPKPKSGNSVKNFDDKIQNLIHFSMEMFGIVAERLSKIVECCAWDHKLLESACIFLHVWCSWMEMNYWMWAHHRPRPVYAVKKLQETIWENTRHPEDDVWISFANLITQLEPVILKFAPTLFASVSEIEDSKHIVCLTPLPECQTLAGLLVFKDSELLRHAYYSAKSPHLKRSQNFIRMRNIHQFGSKFLFQNKFKPLHRTLQVDQTYVYKSKVKVRKTEKERDMCGVDENHYLFHTLNFCHCPPLNEEVIIVRKPDCNNGRVINRMKKDPVPNMIVLPKRPRMPAYENWVFLSDRRFRTEIIVEPYRIVMDTNSFIRGLRYIQVLLGLIVTPIILPVTVILELRGLARGGLSRKDKIRYKNLNHRAMKAKLIESQVVAEQCQLALELIRVNMPLFTVINSTGGVVNIRSPYHYVKDDIFDPSMSNDDRILDTCKYLETADYIARSKETPRRIYRKTILVTGDRILRIRASTMDIPARRLRAVVFWFYCNAYPKLFRKLQQTEKRWRQAHGYYARRYRERVLRRQESASDANEIDRWSTWEAFSTID